MPPRSYRFNAPTNPFLQVLYFIVGGVLLIGAVLMGAVILAVALGIAIILGLVIYVRIWWLRRRLRQSGRSQSDRNPSGSGRTQGDDVLEVEYTVVDERDDRHRRE
jgi:hypothetical protein